MALAVAACNIRHQRKFWADDNNRPDHPLLATDPDEYGWIAITLEQNEQLDQDFKEAA